MNLGLSGGLGGGKVPKLEGSNLKQRISGTRWFEVVDKEGKLGCTMVPNQPEAQVAVNGIGLLFP